MGNSNKPFRLIAADNIDKEQIEKRLKQSSTPLHIESLSTSKVVKRLSFRNSKAQKIATIHFKEECVNFKEQNKKAFEKLLHNHADGYLLSAANVKSGLPHELEVLALLSNNKKEKQRTKEIGSLDGFQLPHWQNFTAVVGLPKNKNKISTLLGHLDVRKNWGEVVIAGFGPGDPELLTVKALRAIEESDIIFHDDLLDTDFLNSFKAEKVYVGKRSKNHAFRQDIINEKLRVAATQGKNVVRLKGGDPFIFGRGIEEVNYLTDNFVNTSVIPGISSAQAAATDALTPLTARFVSSSVAWLSAHDINKLKIPNAETLVFYMGASQQQALAQRLITEGWKDDTPVVIVQNASYNHKKIQRHTLKSLKSATHLLVSPVIIIVGWTAERSRENVPKKWLNTGAHSNLYEATKVHAPLVQIEALPKTVREQVILNSLNSYEEILFADGQSVVQFFSFLKENSKDVRNLNNNRIVALNGSANKELKTVGLIPDGSHNSTSDFLKERGRNKINNNILIVADETEKEELHNQFKLAGNNSVLFLTLHKTVSNESPVMHNLKEFGGVIFSHPLEVERFYQLYEKFPDHLELKCTNSNTKNYLNKLEYYLKEKLLMAN